MKKRAQQIVKLAAFIICIPLTATFFVKPQREVWEPEEYDAEALNARFCVMVDEDIGSFYYTPEKLTELTMYRMIPQELEFSASEDYIAEAGAAHDPEQEYLKALSIVCRSNIAAAWEAQQCPDILAYDSIRFDPVSFYDICVDDVRYMEIQKAAKATRGAVIMNENGAAAVPFFTSTPSDLLVSQAGSGAGFSLNFSYELACQGMDFYDILKYFLGGVKVKIYG